MAYRSELEAALSRLDAMTAGRPCPRCIARATRLRRIGMFFDGLLLFAGALVLLAISSLAGFLAIVTLLVGTCILFSRGGNATPLLVGVGLAFLSATGFAAFFYLERLLSFDVGRFG